MASGLSLSLSLVCHCLEISQSHILDLEQIHYVYFTHVDITQNHVSVQLIFMKFRSSSAEVPNRRDSSRYRDLKQVQVGPINAL